MTRSYKRYPMRFRERAVERMRLGENVSQLARELGIDRTCLYAWKRQLEGRGARRVSGPERDGRDVRIEELEAQVTRLEGVVGRQWLELDFRECLAKDRGDGAEERRQWRASLYAEIRSRMHSQGGLSIQRMCELAGVSRASFYRNWEEREPTAAEMALRDAIQRAALTHRHYGYRRIRVVIQREGFVGGAKKVRRLMQRDNLLAIRQRKFVVTTDSDHTLQVHPNLAQHLQVTEINQLWVADLTYIRLERESPVEFERQQAVGMKQVGWMPATMSFLRHREIYSDDQTTIEVPGRAEPAAASPAGLVLPPKPPFAKQNPANGNC